MSTDGRERAKSGEEASVKSRSWVLAAPNGGETNSKAGLDLYSGSIFHNVCIWFLTVDRMDQIKSFCVHVVGLEF